MILKKPRYAWKNIAAQAILWSLSPLELKDFPPLFGILDAHSLWHAGVPVVGYFWTEFLISDASHFIEKRKE